MGTRQWHYGDSPQTANSNTALDASVCQRSHQQRFLKESIEAPTEAENSHVHIIRLLENEEKMCHTLKNKKNLYCVDTQTCSLMARQRVFVNLQVDALEGCKARSTQ